MKDFGQVFLHCHASISRITNPASGWGVGISANWLHLPLTPGYQLAEVMAFAMPPWQRSSTTAICWLPESHFLDKHGLPTGNVTSHLWQMECKRPLQLSWDPQEPAGPLSNRKPLFCNGHNPSPSCISCKKNTLHFRRIRKEFYLATKDFCIWTESEKKWGFAVLFWFSHWWCWMFNHSFTRTWISLWISPWAAVADPGSGTDLRLVPMDCLVMSRPGCSW